MRFALQRGPGRNPRRHLIGRASPARKGGNLRYQRNPVCVTANTIATLNPIAGDGSHTMTLDDGRVVNAPAWMFAHPRLKFPATGDYWVLNEDDGSLSIYPKGLFERNYKAIEDLNTVSA